MPNQGTSRFRQISRRVAASLFAIVVAVQSGCVSMTPVPKTQHQATLGKVAIVATAQEPEIKFEGFARGKGEGAAIGAGTTFLGCVGGLGGGGCSGAFCGAAVILFLGVCTVASAVGGVAGAVAAPSADSVRTAESTLSAALEIKTIQDSLRDQIAAAALVNGTMLVSVSPEGANDATRTRDYRPLAAAGVETVLEMTLTKAGTRGSGINAPLEMYMQAHVRLVRAGNNAEVFSADYFYGGERLKLSEWSADQGKRLLRALETGYETLGAHIYDSVFLLYSFPDREAHWTGFLQTAFGLAPIYPATGVIGGTTVDKLQPTLRWQGFPRATDVTAAPEDMGRVKNVKYDLVIAREHNLAPAEVVYRREGLSDTAHTIETSLSPATRYFWTVRARFELDGRQRVTEWGSTLISAHERVTAPSGSSYLFKTP